MALVAAFVGFLILRGGGDGDGDERSDGPPEEGDEEGDDDESSPPEPAAEGDAEIPTGDEDIGVVEDAEVERHLLFSSSPTGYQLLPREGGPPAAGTVVGDGERFHRVAKLGPSPLPFDRRLCAYLEPA
jgi:hypothetical protein